MEVMERAFALEAQGRRVLHLEIGEPQFAPPRAAKEALLEALEDGETHYTDSRGLAELREAIAADAQRRHGVSIDPERVLVSSGTSPAMLLVFSLLLEPGDEVVMGTPHYPCYPNFVRYCGGRPVFVPTRVADGYALDPDAVRAAMGPRTRAIVTNSPANPTGAIQSPDTLRALAGFGVPLLSDEIYDGLVYDDTPSISALGLGDDVFVFDGCSKRYAMTGFRLGWVVAPVPALRPLQVMQQNFFISASRFVQHAAIAALEQGAESVAAMRTICERRRRKLAEGLRSLGFGIPHLPAGAFYLLADARHLSSDSRALAFELLEKAGVGATPGIDFGEAAEGHLRFCYAVSEDTLDAALEALARVVPELTDARGTELSA